MSLPQSYLDELCNRISIAAEVGRKVKLTRKGREYSGLCPFHAEKTPSFTVSEEKGFYHCFGCGAHGNVIKFIMNSENLPFMDVVRMFAEKTGLPLPDVRMHEKPEDMDRRAKLLQVCAQSQNWFHHNLKHPQIGTDALAYLHSRGLKDETITQFGLGFAPDNRDGLKNAMLRSNVPMDLAIATGMVIKSDDQSVYDRFRGRVMFPIFNIKNQPVAFGGRILGAGEPKYLNSPETELFHKGRMVYGLNFAAAAMGKSRNAIVVEGYMDAIALHQAGIANVVATLGTAFTEHHVELLWKYADKILLCFDGDNAGLRAALRAIDRILPLLRAGKEVRFITIPSGFDPDTYVQAKGESAFLNLVANATPFYEQLLDTELRLKPIDSPESRADFFKRLKSKLQAIEDQSLREQYRQFVFERIQPMFDQSLPKLPRREHNKDAFGYNRNKKFSTQTHLPAEMGRMRKQADLSRKESEALLAACVIYPKLLAAYYEDLGVISLEDVDLETLRLNLIAIAGSRDITEWPSCLDAIDGHLQLRVKDMCDRSRAMYRWLQRDNEQLVENWQKLQQAFRFRLEHKPTTIVANDLLNEAGWEEFTRQRQQEISDQEDMQLSMLSLKTP